MSVATVSLANTDDDTAGISIAPTTVTLLEGGAGVSYDIVLTSQPTKPFTFRFYTGSQIEGIAPITFERTNWNVPQTVTATVMDDGAIEGEHIGTIADTVASADENYDGLTVAWVSASIADPENSPPTVSTPIGNQTGTEDTPFTLDVTGNFSDADGDTLTYSATGWQWGCGECRF